MKKVFAWILGISLIILYETSYNIFSNNTKLIKTFTNKTTGIIINYYIHDSRIGRFARFNHYHNMTIYYEIDGQAFENKIEYRGGRKKISNKGDTIDILYNPNDPKSIMPEALANWQKDNYEKSKIVLIISLIITIPSCSIFYYLKKKEKIKL